MCGLLCAALTMSLTLKYCQSYVECDVSIFFTMKCIGIYYGHLMLSCLQSAPLAIIAHRPWLDNT